MVIEWGYVCATSSRFGILRGGKQHVGSESMPSVGSSAFFSRSARVQLRLFVPEGPSNGCSGRACKEVCSRSEVNTFCTGVEGVILHLISCRSKNGASHRKNFDTPPLGGNCTETWQ